MAQHDLGQTGEARRALDEMIQFDVVVRSLRGDPRFAAMLRKMNLPPD
jgi:hypothetical protein